MQPPLRKNHRRLLQTLQQPPLNLQAMKKPPSHDRLHALALSFSVTSVQFIRLQVNEDKKWYAPTSQLDALSEWCAKTAPQKVPPIKCEPYEGLFVTDRGDKGLTTDISRSVQCKICEATVPRVCMRTHPSATFCKRSVSGVRKSFLWPPLVGFVAIVSLAPRRLSCASGCMPWSPS